MQHQADQLAHSILYMYDYINDIDTNNEYSCWSYNFIRPQNTIPTCITLK